MAAFCKNKPPADKPEDSHWDWKSKAAAHSRLLSYQSFALIAEGNLQGLMMTNNVTSGKLPEHNLTYYEMTETQADSFRRNHGEP